MTKYLLELINHLTGLKSGMEGNAATWTGQAVAPADVQAKIELLNAKNDEVADLKAQVSVKLAEARLMKNEIKGFADMVENLARGLHSENPEKLVEYDIKLRKPPEPTSKPSKVLTLVMKDDTDGVGFVLSLQEPDDEAEHYDWKKGIGADPKDDLTVPAMSFLISTTKSQYLDDDVPKGERIFYTVRAVNSKGDGPWSAPVSSVQ